MGDLKNILLTGASGFIGSHLVEELVNAGKSITILLRSKNRLGCLNFVNSKLLRKCRIFEGNIINYNDVKVAVKGNDAILHLASNSGFSSTMDNTAEIIETSLLGVNNIIHSAKDTNVEKILFTSSSDVYGKPNYLPVDELHPLCGRSIYAMSKIASEILLKHLSKQYGINVSILRLFNTYGPRQSNRGVIPSIIEQLLTSEEIKVGNISPSRDFTYISDTITGIIKVLESKTIMNQIINIGSGNNHRVSNVIDRIFLITGNNKTIINKMKNKRPSELEINEIVCDNQKLKNLIDWEPSISIEIGLKKTIAWYESIDKYKIDND